MQGKASHGTRFDQRLPLERDFDIQFPQNMVGQGLAMTGLILGYNWFCYTNLGNPVLRYLQIPTTS